MPTQRNHAVVSERPGFQTWALVVGCIYGAVTLFVAIVAVLRVTADAPQSISGYAEALGVAVALPALIGDFWPAGAGMPVLIAIVGS